MKLADHFAAKAGGLAGFLVMAVIGWNFTGRPSETVGENVAPPVTHSSRPRPSKPPGIRDAAVAKMAVIRNAGNPAERMQATIDLANALPLSEFGKWMAGGWFDLRDGAELMLFTHILHERWRREDPEGFVLWSMKNDPDDGSSVLASWAEVQPQQVVEFFKRHPDDKAELAALAGMAKTRPDLALKRLLEMNEAGLFDRDVYWADDLFSAMAADSPAELESALDSLKEPVRKRARKILMLAKFKTDYAGELRKLWTRPDGFEVYYDVASDLKGEPGRIIEDPTDLPPAWRPSIASNAWTFIDEKSAEQWWNADLAGAGFSELEVYMLQTTALQKMATENPEIALQRMAGLKSHKIGEVGIDTGDPSGDGHWFIIKNALSAHPEDAAVLVALLATEKDRGIARDILEGMPRENEVKAANNIETPEQWLENVAVVGPRLSYAYGTMPGTWDSGKRAVLGELFRSLPDDQKQRAAKVLTSSVDEGYLVTSLSGEAIRYLLTQPAEAPVMEPGVLDDPVDPVSRKIPWLREASTYAANLAVTEPETARDWVQSLPEGQPKLWAQLNVHSTWSRYDPKAADQWLNSLPASVLIELKKLR